MRYLHVLVQITHGTNCLWHDDMVRMVDGTKTPHTNVTNTTHNFLPFNSLKYIDSSASISFLCSSS